MKYYFLSILMVFSSNLYSSNVFSLQEVLEKHEIFDTEQVKFEKYIHPDLKLNFVIINAESDGDTGPNDFRLLLMLPNENKMNRLYKALNQNLNAKGFPDCMEEDYVNMGKTKPGDGGSDRGYSLYQPLNSTCEDSGWCYRYSACSFVDKIY